MALSNYMTFSGLKVTGLFQMHLCINSSVIWDLIWIKVAALHEIIIKGQLMWQHGQLAVPGFWYKNLPTFYCIGKSSAS